MTWQKGMKPTKGFTGKKHSEYSKKMMSEGQLRAAKRRQKGKHISLEDITTAVRLAKEQGVEVLGDDKEIFFVDPRKISYKEGKKRKW